MFLSTFTIIIKTNKICHNVFPVWPFLSHLILFSSLQGKSLVTKPDTLKIIHQPVPFDKTLIQKKTVHLNFNATSHFHIRLPSSSFQHFELISSYSFYSFCLTQAVFFCAVSEDLNVSEVSHKPKLECWCDGRRSVGCRLY